MTGVSYKRRRSAKKKRSYRLVATRKRRGKRRLSPRLKRVRRNPMNTLKKSLPIYGGFLAIRVASSYLGGYIAKQEWGTKLGKAAPFVPAGAMFLLSTLVAPKIGFLRKNAKLLEGMQLGSAFALFDVAVKNLVAPALAGTAPDLARALSGYDDVGVMGYGGYGSYIADPTGYSLPPAPAVAEPGVGLDVTEAMALDEYIADPGMGFDVEEVLANSEIDYMQRGGAGGSLAKTVFTD